MVRTMWNFFERNKLSLHKTKSPSFFFPPSVRLLEKFQFLEILCFSSPPAQGGGNVSVSLEYLPSSEDSYRLASNIMLLCMYQELSTISNRCCRNQMSPLRKHVGLLKWGHKKTEHDFPQWWQSWIKQPSSASQHERKQNRETKAFTLFVRQ